jgi:hypothetical protein
MSARAALSAARIATTTRCRHPFSPPLHPYCIWLRACSP